jgi:hypothetical protein
VSDVFEDLMGGGKVEGGSRATSASAWSSWPIQRTRTRSTALTSPAWGRLVFHAVEPGVDAVHHAPVDVAGGVAESLRIATLMATHTSGSPSGGPVMLTERGGEHGQRPDPVATGE